MTENARSEHLGTSRHNNFDGLRLIASLLVVFSHERALSGHIEPMFLGGNSYGHLGVLMFFSISGYLVSASWAADPQPIRFIVRRGLRLIPGAIVACASMYAFLNVLGLTGEYPRRLNPIHLQAFPGPENVIHLFNGSLWTLPFECYCYLILLMLALFVRMPGLYMTAIFLSIWELNGETMRDPHMIVFGLFFCVGALIFHYRALRSPAVLCVLIGAGCYFISLNRDGIGLPLIVAPLTIAIGVQSWPLLRSAGRYGDLSYGIYIYAWPVQQIFIHWLGKDTNYFVLTAPTLAVTVCLAFLSWHLIESPALRLKPRKGSDVSVREYAPATAYAPHASASQGKDTVRPQMPS